MRTTIGRTKTSKAQAIINVHYVSSGVKQPLVHSQSRAQGDCQTTNEEVMGPQCSGTIRKCYSA